MYPMRKFARHTALLFCYYEINAGNKRRKYEPLSVYLCISIDRKAELHVITNRVLFVPRRSLLLG